MDINAYRLKMVKNRIVTRAKVDESEDEFLNKLASKLINADLILFDIDEISMLKAIELGLKVRELCSIYSKIFMVKNRVDVALATHADGVELDENEIPPAIAKELLGEVSIVGLNFKSEHNSFEADYFVENGKIKLLK